MNQKTLYRYNSQTIPFELVNNQILVEVKLNGKKAKFLFDTGSSITLISDSTLIKNLKFTKSQRRVKVAYGGYVEMSEVIVDSLNIYNMNMLNQLCKFTLLPSNIDECNSESSFSGILGMNIIQNFKNEVAIIDFDKSEIYDISLQEIDYSEYSLVSSKTKGLLKQIHINLYIGNDENTYLFDTGNNLGLIHIEDLIGDNISIKTISYDGKATYLHTSKVSLIPNFKFLNDSLENYPVVIQNIHMNNAGMGFIKYFNWILDFKNKRIFAKRNNIPFKEFKILDILRFGIYSGKLIVVAKSESHQSILNVGDILKSINDTLVNNENMCDFVDLLNNRKDVKNLSITKDGNVFDQSNQ